MSKLIKLPDGREVSAKDAKQFADLAMQVTKNQIEAEESCITKVLKAYLKREVKDDDFKKCSRIPLETPIGLKIDKPNLFNAYVLAYENVKLGTIRHIFGDIDGANNIFRVEFKALD
jgi:hypothetical protein